MPLPVFADTQDVSYWVDLREIGVDDGERVEYLNFDYTIDNEPVKEPFMPSRTFLAEVFQGEYNVGGNNPVEWKPESYIEIKRIDWNHDFKVVTWNYRGCTVPNIDLDSSVYNPRDMPGEVGDWNCCSPAAQTNSLQWLENTDSRIPKTG